MLKTEVVVNSKDEQGRGEEQVSVTQEPRGVYIGGSVCVTWCGEGRKERQVAVM